MKQEKYDLMATRAREFMAYAGIAIRSDENIEVSDFGLDMIEEIGLQLCVYINTKRVCADVFTDKRLVRQTKIY